MCDQQPRCCEYEKPRCVFAAQKLAPGWHCSKHSATTCMYVEPRSSRPGTSCTARRMQNAAMHHCYRAIVLLSQVWIPKDLPCVWPQESAGNNGCHAGEIIPDCASCQQRVSGQGTRVGDPRREEGEEAKA